jgi:hypothetical protein
VEARECKCTLEDIADKDSVFVQGSSRVSRPTVSHLFNSVSVCPYILLSVCLVGVSGVEMFPNSSIRSCLFGTMCLKLVMIS